MQAGSVGCLATTPITNQQPIACSTQLRIRHNACFLTLLSKVPKLTRHCEGSTTQTKTALKWELTRSANSGWPTKMFNHTQDVCLAVIQIIDN